MKDCAPGLVQRKKATRLYIPAKQRFFGLQLGWTVPRQYYRMNNRSVNYYGKNMKKT